MRLTNHPRPAAPDRRRRRGMVVTVELLLIAPVILMILMGIAEFYMITTTRIALLNASRAGARVAVSGTYANKKQTNDEVRRTVHEALGTGRLARAARVSVAWSQDVPANERQGQADWVHVRVDARSRTVIPDPFNWAGDTLVAGTLMKQE